ncbi:hypothetical protein M9R32_07870 [Paenisporosarcina quisquiliarum]|uniref:Uncharacterized protein n=1 Tax=Paenisporosarcina quisquiliarum TaxID=365346 RepID=A0A9X3RE37_9BACL|nr:hypothetical protein [Paenisporosarcina quisquiliarum]MCZ8537092.1 hypothetical protein [Paenisporosarcina quisquiliarum]
MLNPQILNDIEVYIQNHLHNETLNYKLEAPMDMEYMRQSESITIDLEDYINNHRKPTLNQVLFRLIDDSGESDVDIYKKAGIDRKLFSKIRSNPDYRPSKNTTIALALALQLDIGDTEELLSAAGYSLSDSNVFDLVIQYCLEHHIHDIYSVNVALDHFNQKCL